jgi:general secretion pathway protein E/type IV pilus assembly protein PilB
MNHGGTLEAKAGVELHLLPRPGERRGAERPRVRRAQRLPGYVAAVDLVCDAVQRRATEVLLEPLREQVSVHMQIDGVDHEAAPIPRTHLEPIRAVFLSWADCDLQPQTRPIEGRFAVELDGGRVDCEIRSEELAGRERITLSIRDQAQRILRFDQLGMPERIAENVRAALTHRSGLLVICGPDDSGRTTTAYGCLHELDRMRRTITTIEAPIHQRVARFEQLAVHAAAGQSSAELLRQILPGAGRQVVFVSDVEDAETADLACLKAEEGRLVIITLRAQDAVAGIFRLVELGLPARRLADVLIGVVSQRLVRILCRACKVRYRPEQAAVRRANLLPERVKCFCRIPEETELKRDGQGHLLICPVCRGIGFHGRQGVFEAFLVHDRLRELLRQSAGLNAIKQEALRSGMHFLQDEAMELVIRGATSIPELLQVLRE